MKRILTFALSTIMLLSILTACGKKGKDSLMGYWVLTSVSLGEQIENIVYDPDNGLNPPQILISEDGSFILQNVNGTTRGTWEQAEKSKVDYIFTFEDESGTQRTCTWEKGDKSFSWENDEGYLMVYERLEDDEEEEEPSKKSKKGKGEDSDSTESDSGEDSGDSEDSADET